MHCPFCSANDTKVIDSRLVAEGEQVRRRREWRGLRDKVIAAYEDIMKMPI